MANWNVCFNWIMVNEDGPAPFKYLTVPDAPGKWKVDSAGHFILDTAGHKIWDGAYAISGINSKSFPADFAIINALPIDKRGPAVEDFYKKNFWCKSLDLVTSDEVAKRVFDAEVNMGIGTGVKILQTALGFKDDDIDGKWGTNTVKACNNDDPDKLVQLFIQERVQHYEDIITKTPALAKYRDAWEIRAKK